MRTNNLVWVYVDMVNLKLFSMFFNHSEPIYEHHIHQVGGIDTVTRLQQQPPTSF